MNLFTARLTGKMSSTDAFEQEIHDMQERVKRWRRIEKSPELAEYLELRKIVEDPKFQAKKAELKDRKYSDTEEGKKMSLREKLSSTWRMRGYKYALENEAFRAFLAFKEAQKAGTPLLPAEGSPEMVRAETMTPIPCAAMQYRQKEPSAKI